jgi:hypothetical protein
MIAQREELGQDMNVERTSVETPALQSDDNLNRLLLKETEKSWFQSFADNVREAINPPKLPPLEVTSKPVPVKDIWGGSQNKASCPRLLPGSLCPRRLRSTTRIQSS